MRPTGKIPRFIPGRPDDTADVIAGAGTDDADNIGDADGVDGADGADDAAEATAISVSEKTPVTKDACVLSRIVSNIVPSCAIALSVTSGMTAIIIAVLNNAGQLPVLKY